MPKTCGHNRGILLTLAGPGPSNAAQDNAITRQNLMLSNCAIGMEERDDARPHIGEQNAGTLCEYELRREEQIRTNNARMQELGVGTQDARDLRHACKQMTSLFCFYCCSNPLIGT